MRTRPRGALIQIRIPIRCIDRGTVLASHARVVIRSSGQRATPLITSSLTLRFSKSGSPTIERLYRTHWLSSELSQRKRERLAEKASCAPEPQAGMPICNRPIGALQNRGRRRVIRVGCVVRPRLSHVRFAPKAIGLLRHREWARWVRTGREQPQQKLRLLDHLVGALLEMDRHVEAERVRSLEVRASRLHGLSKPGFVRRITKRSCSIKPRRITIALNAHFWPPRQSVVRSGIAKGPTRALLQGPGRSVRRPRGRKALMLLPRLREPIRSRDRSGACG
jgi:hypothetical protein